MHDKQAASGEVTPLLTPEGILELHFPSQQCKDLEPLHDAVTSQIHVRDEQVRNMMSQNSLQVSARVTMYPDRTRNWNLLTPRRRATVRQVLSTVIDVARQTTDKIIS